LAGTMLSTVQVDWLTLTATPPIVIVPDREAAS
jgi:hypothetical protein